MKIEVKIANIVHQDDVDAIVNSANANLRLGSGVAGAIHKAAGPELENFCKKFAPLSLGSAVITPGFNLPNKWVIHTVAASFIHNEDAAQILEAAIDSVFDLASQAGIKSIAMPAIGTGVFKCSDVLSASTTKKVLAKYLDSQIEHVRICVGSEKTASVFNEVFGC
jgi:O-acetyl-ADP-ribose deacetylase (regulator of RNase III)